ncbi:MAG: helix-turn-helix transcriptional regulator [Methylobacter sp.]|nr:helix-turn-helix transcriptional regulator [Methylobacter sp.]MDP2169669.1 helix-turn-helix transcriptional regulator [Rhodocyclaceae bacterium]MDP2429018.1 helix-turn-helix transcriptional regulator [Methylobacter sp.]MDP3056519.1 helix-turn-helix transcriptional regulator [Methylobacter sp.]MDP3362008.1 helix-turn-helix transcriptional regulator [Methylobacter sp.]
MTIGGRLKQWREYKKLKQDEASSLLGIPFSTIQKYEMDISKPGADAIIRLINAGINATWLLTGQGPMLVADTVSQPNAPIGDLVEPLVVIDYQRLKLAIETIEEALSKHRSRLQPDQKAKAIGLMYQMYEEEDKKRAKAGQDRASTILNELVKSMT